MKQTTPFRGWNWKQQRASWDGSYPALVPHPVVLGEFPSVCSSSSSTAPSHSPLSMDDTVTTFQLLRLFPPCVLSKGGGLKHFTAPLVYTSTTTAPLVYTSTTARSRGAPLPRLVLLPSANPNCQEQGQELLSHVTLKGEKIGKGKYAAGWLKKLKPERLWKKLLRSFRVRKENKEKSHCLLYPSLPVRVTPSLVFPPTSRDRFTWGVRYGNASTAIPVDKTTWQHRENMRLQLWSQILLHIWLCLFCHEHMNLKHINAAHVQGLWIIKFLSHYASSLYGILVRECT